MPFCFCYGIVYAYLCMFKVCSNERFGKCHEVQITSFAKCHWINAICVHKAMVACKNVKPNRALMIEELAMIDESIGLAECCGSYRWMITLKLGCIKIQLPIAVKCLDMIVRP